MADKKYSKELLYKMLTQMVTIRRFEEKAAQMYGLRKIGGFLHLYIGQEAVAVGSIGALNLKDDYILTTYRDHAHAIACDMDLGHIMAELFGKRTGCSGGKGGSMHFFDAEKHMMGGHGIVGAHIPLATGIAFKMKYKEEQGVILNYFGDGAIHQGAFHESLNLAKIWNLPIVYICENNQYGMGTNFKRVSAIDDFSLMARSYEMKGRQVDGMNILEVYDAVSEFAEEARKGNPGFIEMKTYRYKGHSASDPAKYRTKEELQKYRDSDPIGILKSHMMDKGIITDDEYNEIDKSARKRVEEAVDFAEGSPEPTIDDLYTDIYL